MCLCVCVCVQIKFYLGKINPSRLGELHLAILYLKWTHLQFSSLRRGEVHNCGFFYDDFWVLFHRKATQLFSYKRNFYYRDHEGTVSSSSPLQAGDSDHACIHDQEDLQSLPLYTQNLLSRWVLSTIIVQTFKHHRMINSKAKSNHFSSHLNLSLDVPDQNRCLSAPLSCVGTLI